MLQSDLYRELARATGETIATIKRVGFLVADPCELIADPEAEHLGPHVIDWDEFQAKQEAADADHSMELAPC